MARRFQFRLDPLLRYRKIQEDEKRRQFAEATNLLEQERRKREDFDRERIEMQDEIVRGFQEQAPFQSIVATYNMIGKLDSAIAESRQKELIIEKEVEKRRLALMEASQKKRILEIIRENRREEFVREEERLEQATLDEMSIQGQARRLREKKLAEEEADLAQAEEV